MIDVNREENESVDDWLARLYAVNGVEHEAQRPKGDTYRVRSSDGKASYEVKFSFDGDGDDVFHWECTCRSHEFNPDGMCKHIELVDDLNTHARLLKARYELTE